jgi:hypothetical protein
MKRFLLDLKYRWAMANAYLTQDRAPIASAQWSREAEDVLMDLWRMDRGLR